ncbi:fumarate hydratase, partial [Candidatus Aerophobetes bacterium]
MREIKAEEVKSKVKELFLRANYHIGKDVLEAL